MPDNIAIPPIDGDEKFATASDLHIPPYNWIPPATPPLKVTQIRRKRFSEGNVPECEPFKKKLFEKAPGDEHLSKDKKNLEQIPHPLSDFEHDDPNLTGVKKVEVFQRLKLAFDGVVCETHRLLTAINEAVMQYDPDDDATWTTYKTATEAYVAFMQNLDNHEPKGDAVDPQKLFGYGRNLKWTFMDPIIERDPTGKTQLDLITGVTIVGEWNPHSSSSGIPIYP